MNSLTFLRMSINSDLKELGTKWRNRKLNRSGNGVTEAIDCLRWRNLG